MWSGSIPDLTKDPTLKKIQAVDAYLKRYFTMSYQISPTEFDKMPAKMIDLWNMAANEEQVKRNTTNG